MIAETDGFAALIGGARDRLPALEHLWLLESDLPALTAAGAEVSAETVAERASARGALESSRRHRASATPSSRAMHPP